MNVCKNKYVSIDKSTHLCVCQGVARRRGSQHSRGAPGSDDARLVPPVVPGHSHPLYSVPGPSHLGFCSVDFLKDFAPPSLAAVPSLSFSLSLSLSVSLSLSLLSGHQETSPP